MHHFAVFLVKEKDDKKESDEDPRNLYENQLMVGRDEKPPTYNIC